MAYSLVKYLPPRSVKELLNGDYELIINTTGVNDTEDRPYEGMFVLNEGAHTIEGLRTVINVTEIRLGFSPVLDYLK